MKVKIKDIPTEQKIKICKSITFDDCCSALCPLWEKGGLCAGGGAFPASAEFEEKEIEVDL